MGGILRSRIERDLMGSEPSDDAETKVPPDRLCLLGQGGPIERQIDGHMISSETIDVANETAKQLTLPLQFVTERSTQAQIIFGRVGQGAHGFLPGHGRATSSRAQSSTLA